MPEMLKPTVLNRYEFRGHRAFTVESPGTYDRGKPEIVGEEVEMDGEVWVVIGVERFLPAVPIYPGEHITLIVDPIA